MLQRLSLHGYSAGQGCFVKSRMAQSWGVAKCCVQVSCGYRLATHIQTISLPCLISTHFFPRHMLWLQPSSALAGSRHVLLSRAKSGPPDAVLRPLLHMCQINIRNSACHTQANAQRSRTTAAASLYFAGLDSVVCLLVATLATDAAYWPTRSWKEESLCVTSQVAVRAVVRRAYVTPKYTRHTILTPDGGTVSLDWWHASHQTNLGATTPVLLCLHAFAGRPILDACLSRAVYASRYTCSA